MRRRPAVERTHSTRASSIVRFLLGGLCLVLLPACEKSMRNMYEQPKYPPLVQSELWADGQSARPLEPGVVARSAGALAESSSGRQGDIAQPARTPPPPTMESLRRGRERYDIYCAPCHSVSGDGDGMVVRRGFPAAGSLHSPLMRAASDAHLFDVITDGHGVMYAFADRIGPADRWDIVAYIRALQRSQRASIDDVPLPKRRVLLEETR